MRVPLLCLLAAALQAAVLRPAAVGAAPPPPLHVASPPSAADVQALLDEMHALQRQADALLGAVEEEVAAAEAAGPRRLQAAAGVMFENPASTLTFAQGSAVREFQYDHDGDGTGNEFEAGDTNMPTTNSSDPEPALLSSAPLVVDDDLHVRGSMSFDSSALNLGVPLTAAEPITRGDVVSMASDGRVAKGFGMSVSTVQASVGVSDGDLRIVSHSSAAVSVVRLDHDHQLFAVYFAHGAASSGPARNVTAGDFVTDFTAAAVSATQLLVCYDRMSTSRGYCRAALLVDGSYWEFGEEMEVHSSGIYRTGAVTNLVGVSDRAVLAYAMTDTDNSDQCNAQLIVISGNTASTQGNLPRNIVLSQVDHVSLAALSDFRMVLAYRPVQEQSSRVQELFFDVSTNDFLTVRKYPAVDLAQSGPAEFTHTHVARLDDTRAVVVFRSPQEDNAVRAAVVDVSTDQPNVGIFATVNSGMPNTDANALLRVSVTCPAHNRVGFAFLDADMRPVFVDAGVYGSSIVVGRTQVLASTANTAGALGVAAVALDATTGRSLSVFQMDDGMAMAEPAVTVRTTMFGGPTMLGLAKTSGAAGERVTVLIQGALDAYTDLVPGAPYFARYDGGIGATPESNGAVSSAVVGTALTPTTLLSEIGANVVDVRAGLSDLTASIGNLQADLSDLQSCHKPVWDGLKNTQMLRTDLPVFRYAAFKTYAYGAGWVMNNDRDFFGGVAPSEWGNGNYYAYQMYDQKKYWGALFTQIVFADSNALVRLDEWYHSTSDDSRHIITLMRINNPTSEPIQWTMFFKYSSYSGYSERASVAMNGQHIWGSEGNNCGDCEQSLTLTFPPNLLSSVITVSSTGHPSTTRTTLLHFYNDCLRLPAGLEWVDDLHYNGEGNAEYV